MQDRVQVGEVELDYEETGAGEPVVLIHAGVFADWFKPLQAEPALAPYRLIRYHRPGYAGSTPATGSLPVSAHAAHCRGLLDALGVRRAHIVGHSSSSNFALQLALDHPLGVQSIALLELAMIPRVPSSQGVLDALGHYRAGDKAAAVDKFMQAVGGTHYRGALERALPGAFEQAVADADTFFGQEIPGLREWDFSGAHAARIEAPVLAVLGAASEPVFRQRHNLLRAWLPDAEEIVIPGATHLFPATDPKTVAEALAAFYAKHPIET